MTDFIALNDPKHVDLNRHGMIEASAGTGKTYTLIELVMRALIEQRLTIDKILLVTFTEQATGELKSRIRIRILAELHKADLAEEVSEHLNKALQQLNQASVYTIHGFCHRTLKEYAFEQSAVFDSEVVNDNELRAQILHQMKRSWPDDKGLASQLRAFVGDKSLQKVDDLLLQLAQQFKPNIDVFYPSMDDLSDASIMQKFELLKDIDLSLLSDEFNALQGLKNNAYDKNWLGIIKPFLIELKDLIKKQELDAIHTFLQAFYKNNNEVISQFLTGNPAVYKSDHKNSRAVENIEAAPQLFSLCSELDRLYEAIKQFEVAQKVKFIPKLLDQLNEKVQHHKLSNGLISYDDMITQLWEQLSVESQRDDQPLTQAIRSQYQVALIDEFQDTDLKQWQIFKQLFLCDKRQLYVIGDPKQAIYSFRGADVNTYRSAVAEIQSIYGGKAYRLQHNYRTTKPLVAALNQFFAKSDSGDDLGGDSCDRQGGWFESPAVTVEVPKQNTDYTPPKVLKNPHSIAPLNQIQVEVSKSKADAIKKNLAEQIAQTINFQLLNQVEVSFKGQTKYLEPSDVCVLVRSKGDAEFLEEALQALAIPFSYHKKQDLYQSEEAIHFQILLTALAEPDRKKRFNNLLVSLFFDIKPKDIPSHSENDNNINKLWSKVKLACNQKDWVKVFDTMLRESGALIRLRHNTRRIANIKQIQQQLLDVALKSNCEAKALLKTFISWREKNTSEEALHQKDTEQSAVKIMTMHTSKGLEFPVVFLLGGLNTTNKHAQYLKFYDQNRQKTVFDLVNAHQKIHDQQQLEEDQQLFYVAMTRAIFMLFLPNVVGESSSQLNGAYANTVMPRIEQLKLPVHTVDQSKPIETKQLSTVQQVLSLPELPVLKNNRSINLYSFSSLSRIKAHRQESLDNFDVSLASAAMMTDELVGDELTQDGQPEIQVAQVPGGVKTGLALHGIFENVSFDAVINHHELTALCADETIMSVVDEQMRLFRLENKPLLNELGEVVSDYRYQLAAWVWHTLKKPLAALNGQILGSLSQAQRSHELSFFWHQDNTNLTGFIDLFFAVPSLSAEKGEMHQDYYILDWKSNLSINGYSPQILADEVMQKHQYNWQYQLYAMAMQRWFDGLGMKNATLKGALYVFSRGMDCFEAEQNGVFFDDFTRKDWNLAEIERDLLAFTQSRKDS